MSRICPADTERGELLNFPIIWNQQLRSGRKTSVAFHFVELHNRLAAIVRLRQRIPAVKRVDLC